MFNRFFNLYSRIGAGFACCIVAASSPASCAAIAGNELLSERESGATSLDKFQRGSTLGRLNRGLPSDMPASRTVIAVLGITGAGKSATGNTLAGRLQKPFAASASVTSVSTAVSFRDYSFLGQDYRIIDTPGLSDTNRPVEEIEEELAQFASFAPHGVGAFVIAVPHGRFTAEHEAALRRLLHLFGPSLKQHALLAVTSATQEVPERPLLTRDELLDEIRKLPPRHFLRALVEELHLRLVPVENLLDPHKQISRFQLHQRVQDILQANHGRTYACSNFQLPSAAGAVGAASAGISTAALAAVLSRLGPCTSVVTTRTSDRRHVLRLECALPDSPAHHPS